jgi:hypothetical protein
VLDPLLIVLASRHDVVARQLVERWEAYGACLLTCRDLSEPGWRYRLADPAAATAVIAGRPVAASEIRGVLIRLPWVTEDELPHIVPSDRSYVAAEMSAFLVFWLSELTCPILNRPSPGRLNGPSWRSQQWIAHAAQVGLRVVFEERQLSMAASSTPRQPSATYSVTVVGDQCIGAADNILRERSRDLATSANVDLLGVSLSGSGPDAEFVSATVFPEIGCVEVSDAILQYFQRT